MNDEETTMLENGEVCKLTKWKKEPTVRLLKEDLQMAENSQKIAATKIDMYLDHLNITGPVKLNKVKGRSAVQPKLIRKQAEWRYASLSEPFLSTEDVYNIYPVTSEDKRSAEQNQLILNNQFNTKMDKVKFIDDYVRTSVDEGTVIIRVGWDFEERNIKKEVPVYDYHTPSQEDMFILQQAMQMQQQDPDKYQAIIPANVKEALKVTAESGSVIMANKVDVTEEEVLTTVKNQPTVSICHYKNFFADPLCKGDLSKAEFVIYSYETSLDELEKDGIYENLNKIHLTNASPLSDPDHYETTDDDSVNFKDETRKKVVAYEYWGNYDIHGSGTTEAIVATWIGDVMIRLEENPYPDKKHPFVAVQYLPVRNSLYGEPDGSLLIDNQAIIGATTRGMIDIMARCSNGQVGLPMNALDAPNRRKFDRGDDYEYNPNITPDSFHMGKFPEIPQAAPLMLQLQNSEAESLTGVTAFSSGLTGKSLGDTATGVRGVLDAATKRELGILRRLGHGIIEIGRKIIAMNAEFLSEEEVVRITNDEFVQIRRDDLAGNFDLRLSISTAEADNQKAEELAFMLQTMGNNMDPSMSRMILADIAKLRKMPTLAKKIEEFQPQPNPEVVKKAQLENALLEAQVMKTKAEMQEVLAEIQSKGIKANTDQMKAQNLQADTDIKNLNYLEQESGVTQERDLEKQRAQAKANSRMKLMEHALKQEEKNKSSTGSEE